uniref:Uncharacterized protein n=1 Tax=viral metagenome TaxID=1070528 RepID=A0A6M3XNY1_9ZZZZ
MKVTGRQVMLMYQILQDSVRVNIAGVFSISLEDRLNLVNEIINQQDTILEGV